MGLVWQYFFLPVSQPMQGPSNKTSKLFTIFMGTGSLVCGESVGEHCCWMEDTDGLSTRGVGYCGFGQGDDRVQVE